MPGRLSSTLRPPPLPLPARGRGKRVGEPGASPDSVRANSALRAEPTRTERRPRWNRRTKPIGALLSGPRGAWVSAKAIGSAAAAVEGARPRCYLPFRAGVAQR